MTLEQYAAEFRKRYTPEQCEEMTFRTFESAFGGRAEIVVTLGDLVIARAKRRGFRGSENLDYDVMFIEHSRPDTDEADSQRRPLQAREEEGNE